MAPEIPQHLIGRPVAAMAPEIPRYLRGRPIVNGFVQPWFVDDTRDPIDFRLVDQRKLAIAHRKGLCWVCGQPRGRHLAFPIGPMCSINRISAEPPSHEDCARYSVAACPFLSRPKMRRSPRDLPDDIKDPPGKMILRNPGVIAIWLTRSYSLMKAHTGGYLFQLGEPDAVEWYCEGRAATREEILASVESGFPILLKEAEREGREAIEALAKARERAMTLLPAAA